MTDARSLWCNLEDADFIRERLDFPDCRIAIRVDRAICDADGEILSFETRYFVSSIDPEQASALDLLRHIRGHWQVENCLHFVKDRWWDEDRHHTRRPGLAERFASLTNAALSVLRFLHIPDRPLRATAELVQWSPITVLDRLGYYEK